MTDWDCIVLDEYHFGAWRDNARDLYDPTDKELAEAEEPEEEVTEEDLGLDSAHYLYLSGTPFRAITNGEFTEDQTFNWTYVDEQAAKEGWDRRRGPNPYLELPRMEMYAYEIAPGAAGWAEDGEFSGFSLTEYFKAKRVGNGRGRRSRATASSTTRAGSPSSSRCCGESSPSRSRSRSSRARSRRSRTSTRSSPTRSSTRSGTCPMSPRASRCATCSPSTHTSRL